MIHVKGLDVRSILKSAVLPALALCFVAACGVDPVDDEDTASTDQAVAGGCHILRPYGWSVGFNVCGEGPIVPSGTVLELGPGDSQELRTVIRVVGQGRGAVTLVCRSDGSGLWDEVDRTCLSKIIIEQ